MVKQISRLVVLKSVVRWSGIRGGREEREDAAAKFFGCKAVGGGVEGAGNDPELFGAARGGVNHFRMTAGKRDISFIAYEENGKSARGDRFYRRNFRDGKTSEFFVAVEQSPGAGSEKSFAEPGIFPESGVIVGCFADAGERSFSDDGFDARIDGRGLQNDSSAHGFTEGEEMRGRGRGFEPRHEAGVGHLHGNIFVAFGSEEGVDDGARVIAFEPAVGGDRAAASAVGAGVHHDDAVAGAQQKFRLTDDSDAIVGDAVEDEDPVAVGILGADFPSTKRRSIRGFHVEVFAGCAGGGEGGVGFADKIGRQLAADGMKEGRSSEPSGNGGQERREEQQNQSDANQAAAHGAFIRYENAAARRSNEARM